MNFRFLSAFFILLILTGIYLNRSYAHIFDYDKSRGLIEKSMPTSYTLEEGNGQKKIKYVSLGDSLTYGLGATSYKSTFPYVFSQNLLRNYSQIQVVNLAVSGAVAEDLLKTQLPKAINEKPDLITIMIGTNDVHNYVSGESFGNSLEIILDSLQKNTKAKIIIINIPYLGTDSRILPPYDKILNQKIKDFNKIIEDVSMEKNVRLVDLYSKSYNAFKENPGLYYSMDQFHPSDAGYVFWGDLINAN